METPEPRKLHSHAPGRRKVPAFYIEGRTYGPGVVIHEWVTDNQWYRFVKLGKVGESLKEKAATAAYAIERMHSDALGNVMWTVDNIIEDFPIMVNKERRSAALLARALEDAKK
jgi:hypothetical protein